MHQPPNDLRWIPESIANILHSKGIHNRDQLARHLDLSRATIYRAFGKDWSGTATMTVLVRLAYTCGAPLAALVSEPAGGKR